MSPASRNELLCWRSRSPNEWDGAPGNVGPGHHPKEKPGWGGQVGGPSGWETVYARCPGNKVPQVACYFPSCNKPPRAWMAENNGMEFSQCRRPEARNPRRQVWLLPEGLRRKAWLPLPSPQAAARNPWGLSVHSSRHSLTWRSLPCRFPSSSVLGLRAHPRPGRPHHDLTTSAKTLSPN